MNFYDDTSCTVGRLAGILPRRPTLRTTHLSNLNSASKYCWGSKNTRFSKNTNVFSHENVSHCNQGSDYVSSRQIFDHFRHIGFVYVAGINSAVTALQPKYTCSHSSIFNMKAILSGTNRVIVLLSTRGRHGTQKNAD